MQDPVDAIADPQVVLGRFDVDVGGPLLNRLQDDQVHELDDGSFLDDSAERCQVLLLVERVVDHDLGDVVDLLVELAALTEQVGQLRRGDRDPAEPLVEQGTQVVDGAKIARIDHAHDQLAVLAAQRHGLVPMPDVFGQEASQRRVAHLGSQGRHFHGGRCGRERGCIHHRLVSATPTRHGTRSPLWEVRPP